VDQTPLEVVLHVFFGALSGAGVFAAGVDRDAVKDGTALGVAGEAAAAAAGGIQHITAYTKTFVAAASSSCRAIVRALVVICRAICVDDSGNGSKFDAVGTGTDEQRATRTLLLQHIAFCIRNFARPTAITAAKQGLHSLLVETNAVSTLLLVLRDSARTAGTGTGPQTTTVCTYRLLQAVAFTTYHLVLASAPLPAMAGTTAVTTSQSLATVLPWRRVMLREGLLELIMLVLTTISKATIDEQNIAWAQSSVATSVVLLSVRAVDRLLFVEGAMDVVSTTGPCNTDSVDDNAHAAVITAAGPFVLGRTLREALQVREAMEVQGEDATENTVKESKCVLMGCLGAMNQLCRGSASRRTALAEALSRLGAVEPLVRTCLKLAVEAIGVDGDCSKDQSTSTAELRCAVELLATLAEEESTVKMVVMGGSETLSQRQAKEKEENQDQEKDQEKDQESERQRRVRRLEELLTTCSKHQDISIRELAIVFVSRVFAHQPSAMELVDYQSTVPTTLLNVCALDSTRSAVPVLPYSLTMVAYASAGITNMCTNSLSGPRGQVGQGAAGEPSIHPLIAARMQSLRLDLGGGGANAGNDTSSEEGTDHESVSYDLTSLRLNRLCALDVAGSLQSMLKNCTTLVADSDAGQEGTANVIAPLVLRANASRVAHTLTSGLSHALRRQIAHPAAVETGSGEKLLDALQGVANLLLCLWGAQLQAIDARLAEGSASTIEARSNSLGNKELVPVHATDNESSVLELTLDSLVLLLRVTAVCAGLNDDGVVMDAVVARDAGRQIALNLLRSGALQLIRRLFRAALLEEEDNASSAPTSTATLLSSLAKTAAPLSSDTTTTAATLTHAATAAELLYRISALSPLASATETTPMARSSFRMEAAMQGIQAEVCCGRRMKGRALVRLRRQLSGAEGKVECGVVTSLRSMVSFCNTHTALARRASTAVANVLEALLGGQHDRSQSGQEPALSAEWGAECALLLVRAELGVVKLLVFLANSTTGKDSDVSHTCRFHSLRVLLLLCCGGRIDGGEDHPDGRKHQRSNGLWVVRACLRAQGVPELAKRVQRETMGSGNWGSAEKAQEAQKLALTLGEALERDVSEDEQEITDENKAIEEDEEDEEDETGEVGEEAGGGRLVPSSEAISSVQAEGGEDDSSAGKNGEEESMQATNREIEQILGRFRDQFLERMLSPPSSAGGWGAYIGEAEEAIRAVKGLLPSRRCRMMLLKAGFISCLCHYERAGGGQLPGSRVPWLLAPPNNTSGEGGGGSSMISAGVRVRMFSVQRDFTDLVATLSEDTKCAAVLAEEGGADVLVRLINCFIGEMKSQHLRALERCATALQNIMQLLMKKKIPAKGVGDTGEAEERGKLQQLVKRVLGGEAGVLVTLTKLLSKPMSDGSVAMRLKVVLAVQASCGLWGSCARYERLELGIDGQGTTGSGGAWLEEVLKQAQVVPVLLRVLGTEEMKLHRELATKTNRFKQQHLRGIVVAAAAALALLTSHAADSGYAKLSDAEGISHALSPSSAAAAAASVLENDGASVLLTFTSTGALRLGEKPPSAPVPSETASVGAGTDNLDNLQVYSSISSILLGCSRECATSRNKNPELIAGDMMHTLQLLCRECTDVAPSGKGGKDISNPVGSVLRQQDATVLQAVAAAAIISDGFSRSPLSLLNNFAPAAGSVCALAAEFGVVLTASDPSSCAEGTPFHAIFSRVCQLVCAYCDVGCDSAFELALTGGTKALLLGIDAKPEPPLLCTLLDALDKLAGCSAVGAHAVAGALQIEWQRAGGDMQLSHSSLLLGNGVASENEMRNVSQSQVLAVATRLNAEGGCVQLVELQESLLGLLHTLACCDGLGATVMGSDLNTEGNGGGQERDEQEGLVSRAVRCVGGVAAFISTLRATCGGNNKTSDAVVSALHGATSQLLELLSNAIKTALSSLREAANASAVGDQGQTGPMLPPALQQLLVSVLATLAVTTKDDAKSAALAVTALTKGGGAGEDNSEADEAPRARKLRTTRVRTRSSLLETLVGVATVGLEALLLTAGLDTSATSNDTSASSSASWALREPAMGVLLGICSHRESLDVLLASPSTRTQAKSLLSKLLQTGTACTLADIRHGTKSQETSVANRQSRERTLVLCTRALTAWCECAGNDIVGALLHGSAEAKNSTVCSLWCRSLLFHRGLCDSGEEEEGEMQQIKEKMQQMQQQWHGTSDFRQANATALLYRWGRLRLTLTGFTKLAGFKSVSTGPHGLLAQAGEGAGGGVPLLLALLRALLDGAEASSVVAKTSRRGEQESNVQGHVAVGPMLMVWDVTKIAATTTALQHRLCEEQCACMRLVCVALCEMVRHLRAQPVLAANKVEPSGSAGRAGAGESVCEMIGLHRSSAVCDLVALLVPHKMCGGPPRMLERKSTLGGEVAGSAAADGGGGDWEHQIDGSRMLPLTVCHAAACAVSCFADLADAKLRNDFADASIVDALLQIVHRISSAVPADSLVIKPRVECWPQPIPDTHLNPDVWLFQEEDGSCVSGGNFATDDPNTVLLVSSMRALGKLCQPHPQSISQSQFSPAVQPHIVPAHMRCRNALTDNPLPTMSLLLRITTSATPLLLLGAALRVLAGMTMSEVWPRQSDSHLCFDSDGTCLEDVKADSTTTPAAERLSLDSAGEIVQALNHVLQLAEQARGMDRGEWGSVIHTVAAVLWGIAKHPHLQSALSAEVLSSLIGVLGSSFCRQARVATLHYSLALYSVLSLVQPGAKTSRLQAACEEKPKLLAGLIAVLVQAAGESGSLFPDFETKSSSLRATASAHTSTMLNAITDSAVGRRVIAGGRGAENDETGCAGAVALLRRLQQVHTVESPPTEAAAIAATPTNELATFCDAYSARQAAEALANLSSDPLSGTIQDSTALRQQAESALQSLKTNCGVIVDQGATTTEVSVVGSGSSGLAVAEQAARSLCALASNSGGDMAREELCELGAPATVARIVGAIAASLMPDSGAKNSAAPGVLSGRLRLMRHLLGAIAGMVDHKRSREVLMRTTGNELQQGGVYAWLLTLIADTEMKGGSEEERRLRLEVTVGAVIALERISAFADGRRRSLTSFTVGLEPRLSTVVRCITLPISTRSPHDSQCF
jgi:hypothetical protein